MIKKEIYAHEFNDWKEEDIWEYIEENDLKWKRHYAKDFYRVFENGLIYSEKSNRFLKQSVNATTGYSSCASELTHRVILKTYLPHENQDHLQVNHIDGVKLNNHNTNLEWATRKENMAHAVENNMLGQMKKVRLYDLHGEQVGIFDSLSDACRHVGINEKSFYEVLSGKLRHMRGYRVKPIEFSGVVEPLDLSNDYFSAKGVVQLTMEGEFIAQFEKMAHAYKALGKTDNGTISQVCKGRKPHAWKYKWVYAHEYFANKSKLK